MKIKQVLGYATDGLWVEFATIALACNDEKY